jgi:hypothetical protein
MDECYIPSKVNIEVMIFTRYDSSDDSSTSLEPVFTIESLNTRSNNQNDDVQILDYPYSDMEDLSNFTSAVRFEGNMEFSFFTIMNEMISATISLSDSNNYKYSDINRYATIKGLPVVGKHYIYNYNVFQDLFNTLDTYYLLLTSNFDKLENNTNVNVKFYNTYGPSTYLSCNRIDIGLDLIIKLVGSYSNDLDYNIKKFIMNFVENTNDTDNSVLAISNLIKELEDNFEDIKYIRFNGFNCDDGQVITNSCPSYSEMTKEQLINYIPEYLNITLGQDTFIYDKDNFVSSINIKYE